ncbi:hypothetical protein [Actinomadura sp. WAC 06369]|uniref:hypothetical protein n=1 Tax=Actinomadura sp. WAC 06369 TaxID=2203193 RepID=UPI000F78F154|nr:hypothetical protein [Actinomadura sp. WAC 06369]
MNNAVMYSGYYFGGILTALAGLLLLPHVDFRVLYALGALPTVFLSTFASLHDEAMKHRTSPSPA